MTIFLNPMYFIHLYFCPTPNFVLHGGQHRTLRSGRWNRFFDLRIQCAPFVIFKLFLQILVEKKNGKQMLQLRCNIYLCLKYNIFLYSDLNKTITYLEKKTVQLSNLPAVNDNRKGYLRSRLKHTNYYLSTVSVHIVNTI